MVNLPHTQVADGDTNVVFSASSNVGSHAFTVTVEQFANGIDGAQGYQYVSTTTSEADNTVITASLDAGSNFLTSSDMDVYIGDQQPNLPAGVTFNSATNTLTLDPSDAAYQSLNTGDTQDVVVNYTIEDGNGGSVGQTVTWTVTGADEAAAVNNPPAVTAALTEAVTEDGALSTVDLLSGASDADGDLLSANVNVGALPAGVTFNSATNALTLDPSDAAYQSLNTGETQDVVVSYTIEDGNGGSVGQTVTWTVTGADEAYCKQSTDSDCGTDRCVTEDGAVSTVNLLTGANDADGDPLMVNLPHVKVADGDTIEVGVFSATQISLL